MFIWWIVSEVSVSVCDSTTWFESLAHETTLSIEGKLGSCIFSLAISMHGRKWIRKYKRPPSLHDFRTEFPLKMIVELSSPTDLYASLTAKLHTACSHHSHPCSSTATVAIPANPAAVTPEILPSLYSAYLPSLQCIPSSQSSRCSRPGAKTLTISLL